MAAERKSGFAAAVIGGLSVLLVLASVAAVVVFAGFYPIAASGGHVPVVGWVLEKTMHNSVSRQASDLTAPQLSRSAILGGGSHFKGMCQQCHGGPGAMPEPFATAMNPDPPELTQASREFSREEIFWITKHGIAMTGMPAFGQSADDQELWEIAAFVEQLPAISASEYAALPDAHADESGDHSH